MLISEKKLRKIIKKTLLKESFLSGKVESLNTAVIKNKKYLALGYTTGFRPQVLFQAPKEDDQFLKSAGAKLVDYGKTYTIKNYGSEFLKSPKSGKKNDFYLIDVSNKNLTLLKEMFDSGKSSTADYAIQILDLAGVVPVIGDGADISSALLAI